MVFSKLNWILSLNLLRSTMLDLKYSKDTFSFESSSWRIHVSLQKAEGLCFMFDVPQSVTCHVMAVGHQGSNIPSPTSSSSLFGFHDHCWNLLTWQGPFSIPVSSRGTFTWRAFQTQDKPINELTSFFSKEGNPKINHPRIVIESSLNHPLSIPQLRDPPVRWPVDSKPSSCRTSPSIHLYAIAAARKVDKDWTNALLLQPSNVVLPRLCCSTRGSLL